MHSIIFFRRASLSICGAPSILEISLFSCLTSMLGSLLLGSDTRMLSGVMPARMSLTVSSRSVSATSMSSRQSLFSQIHRCCILHRLSCREFNRLPQFGHLIRDGDLEDVGFAVGILLGISLFLDLLHCRIGFFGEYRRDRVLCRGSVHLR